MAKLISTPLEAIQFYSPGRQLAPVPKKEDQLLSTGWKDVTLRIHGTDDQITIPVMTSSRVWDVKKLLAEMHGDVDPNRLEFVFKLGPSYKRHRNSDEIATNILVKGIKGFAQGIFEWPHPYMVIGAGHMGLRQAIHYTRHKVPFTVFERKSVVGGNAWVGIANPTSKLQTEGPHYQMQYDVHDKNVGGLMLTESYSYWPTTEEILRHLEYASDYFGVTALTKLDTEVTDMVIVPEPYKGADIREKRYDFHYKSTKPGNPSEGDFTCSCMCIFPGCLVVPHRKTWPGEDVFGGNIGYGFACEFNYVKVKDQDTVIIGMGAFAHENVRTIVEHGGRKCWNIARHFNLMLPRVLCWWVNQSSCPPTAAMILDAMKPMYSMCGWDPWTFFSVTANAERTVASIKQYTRWGISDIFFLSIYFGLTEVINAEVKRMKPRCVVLNNGKVLEDVDHVCKVIGFDADFGVDRLMQTSQNIGPFPDGDWRRFTLSDQSAIDASRFANIALSPAASSLTNMTLYFHQHPKCGVAAIESGMLPVNISEPELGSPCYHWAPRQGTASMMMLSSFAPALGEFEYLNNNLKKDSMLLLAPPEQFCKACEHDWFAYARLFRDNGHSNGKPVPSYPYPLAVALNLQEQEAELFAMEEQKAKWRMTNAAGEEVEGNEDPGQKPQGGPGGLQSDGAWLPCLEVGSGISFEPARKVLQARLRSVSPTNTKSERKAWLKEAHEVKDYLREHCRKPVRSIRNSMY